MKETRVALRYAKSLISLAEERDVLEQVKGDMEIILSVCEESQDFSNMLKSPVVKADKKSAILNQVFGNKISELSLSFLNLLTSKKREAILGAEAENYVNLYNESKNIVSATVTTAAAITEDIKAQVLTQLKSVVGDADVRIEERVDASLIGGFVLRVGDLEFNASVANKLQKLKREFVSNRT